MNMFAGLTGRKRLDVLKLRTVDLTKVFEEADRKLKEAFDDAIKHGRYITIERLGAESLSRTAVRLNIAYTFATSETHYVYCFDTDEDHKTMLAELEKTKNEPHNQAQP